MTGFIEPNELSAAEGNMQKRREQASQPAAAAPAAAPTAAQPAEKTGGGQ
jgi:hypothetical protein